MKHFLLGLWLAAVSADACDFEKLAKISPTFADALKKVHAPELRDAIRHPAKPGWQVVQAAEEARVGLHAAVKEAREQGLMTAIEETAQTMDPRAPREKPKSGPVIYQPTEYELKRDMQRNLIRSNRQLPTQLQVEVPRLPRDSRRITVPQQAREIIAKQTEKFETLYPTTGFENPDAYRAAVESSGDHLKEMYEMLDKDEVQIAIRRPERGRWWIPRTGFQNQFVTGSSNGAFNHDGRNRTEAMYLQLPKPEYSGFDAELKPQYVFIAPPKGSPWDTRDMASQYGGDIYILKKEDIRDRLTFTPADSLNRHCYAGYCEREAQVWDEMMVPWKHRTLLAPFLVHGRANYQYRVSAPHADAPVGFKQSWGTGSTYTEAQVFGGLRLENVAEFQFTYEPPSGEFLDALQRRGIPIYDARQPPPVPWRAP